MSYGNRDHDCQINNNVAQFYDPTSGKNFCVIGAGSNKFQGRTWAASKAEAGEHGRALLAKSANIDVDEFLIVQVVARVRRTAPQVEIVDVN